MRAEIRPINHRGKPLAKSLRMKQPPSSGELRIFENRMHAFGRVVLCATLTSATDGIETEQLPELVDAQVIWLDDRQMRIRGVELVEGILFAQTWDIRVL